MPSTAATMRFASFVSDSESSDRALAEVIESAKASPVTDPDVAFVFLTAHHRDQAEDIIEKIWLELDPRAVIGCSAEGVIGGEVEIERAPGLALMLGSLPDVRIHPFHIGADAWRAALVDADKLTETIGLGPECRAVIGFGDPFTTPMNQFMQAMDAVAPNSPLIGGMASAARQAGENVLVRNDALHDDGFVGVSLSGSVQVETLVSQGCRPIGSPMVVTKAHDNVLEQLGGRPALKVLHDLVQGLDESDQKLLQNGLLLGRAISEYREKFRRGDFLVRNLMAVDQEAGAIAVADYVRVGQTVQFHVRDAATASEDLSEMLREHVRAHEPSPPAAGALLFSCNGRGTQLFSQPCHDVGAARASMPQTPVAGFFAAGELGPVGGKNFIHGHTASFAIFRRG